MASNYATALESAVTIIEGLVPADESTIRYRQCPRGFDLADVPLSTSPHRNTRLFEVAGEPDPDPSVWNGSTAQVHQSFVVRVLYHCPGGEGRDGIFRARSLSAADAAALAHALNIPQLGVGFDDTVRNCFVAGPGQFYPRDETPDVWLLELRFTLTYGVAA